jgi:hypothetical protein
MYIYILMMVVIAVIWKTYILYMDLYIFVIICTCACINMYVYICIYLCILTHISIRCLHIDELCLAWRRGLSPYIYVYMYIYIYIYIYTYLYIYKNILIHPYTCRNIYLYISIYMYTFICIYWYKHIITITILGASL